MKFSLRIMCYTLTLFTFLGCSQGLMIIDPYWDIVLQTQGIKIKYLAWRYYFSYQLLPHGELDQIITFARKIVAEKSKKGDIRRIILSPLLKEYAEELIMNGHNVGIFATQGVNFFHQANNLEHKNKNPSKKSIHRLNLNRHMILKELAQESCNKNKSLLIIYTNEDDFKIFTDIFKEDQKDLISVKVVADMGIERIGDEVELALGLSKVNDIFLLAEPYNARIWKRLEQHYYIFDNIYTGGGLLIRKERAKMLVDNIKGQMEALVSGIDKEIFIELLTWNEKSKKFRRKNLEDISL